MRAELLAVGSELLVPGRQETNASTITRYLLERGCQVIARTTIADDARALTESFLKMVAIATVDIAEFTNDGLVRHAVFVEVSPS